MELSILLFQKILSMALIMMMGYLVRRAGVVKAEHTPLISALMLYVFCPCMVINAFMIPYDPQLFRAFLIALAGGFVVQLFLIGLAWLTGRTPFAPDATEQGCMAFTNSGNLLMPLINSLLGPEYLLFSVPMLFANTVIGWFYFPPLFHAENRPNARQILRNPSVSCIYVGILLFRFGIRFPGVIEDTLRNVTNAVGVMSMLLTGMLMAGIDLKAAFTSLRNILIALMRLIVFPLIVILVMRVLGLYKISDMLYAVMLVLTMGAAAPTATNVLVMSNLYGGRAELASAVSAMTTALCVLTLPLMVYIFQMICK